MRLTVEQLQEMMIDTESDRIERTVSIDKTDKFVNKFGSGILRSHACRISV